MFCVTESLTVGFKNYLIGAEKSENTVEKYIRDLRHFAAFLKGEVTREKVFPHNLRHLFARTFYAARKDIVRLADILGHASINTTRIYTAETGEVHLKQLGNLGLLLC